MGATLSILCSTLAEEGRFADYRDVRFSCLAFDCRCLAIETLYKVKIDPASDVDNEQWTQISDKIPGYYDEMLTTLQELESIPASANSSISQRIDTVLTAFGTGLLPYLQAQVELMKKLRAFLPEQEQSWEDFLMDMNTDILENVEPSARLQELKTFKQLTARLMSAINGVDEYVQQSGEPQSVQKIKVFYATNRDVDDAGFISKPTNILRYGFQVVSIPGGHTRGKVESPYKSGQGNHSDHFMLDEKLGPWSKSDVFLQQIQGEWNSANDVESPTGGPQKNAREVLLYIHGYTVSYDSALKRAAQLKNDLEFEGLVILYSWPTMGHPLAYHQDRKVIKTTAPLLREFITTILGEEDSFSKVHILAHSMGNRALIKALTKWKPLLSKGLVHRRGVLKNVILAAADEKLGKFEEMLREMNKPDSVLRPLISVYSSARDKPLLVSGYINWRLRLGNTVCLFGNRSMLRGDYMVDVIDASGVRYDSFLQHSYHAEAPEVLDDIQDLLILHHRAGRRPDIQPYRHASGQVFHACAPLWWDESKFNGCIKKINQGDGSSSQVRSPHLLQWGRYSSAFHPGPGAPPSVHREKGTDSSAFPYTKRI